MSGPGVDTWFVVLALALLSLVTTAIGVELARRAGHRPALVAAGIGFSTGIMVLLACWELLPAAADQTDVGVVVAATVAGIAVVALLHVVIPHIHLADESDGIGAVDLRAAYLVAFGLILHDLPEGVAMANSFVADARLGVLAAVTIALHNLPEEFALALPAVVADRPRTLMHLAATSAVAEPVGALVGLAGVGLYPGLNGAFLAFAAGAMLYVSLHELVPLARGLERTGAFATGGLASVAAFAVLTVVVGS